ncbi:hypothetical protein BSZ21_02085 [Bradyrhizobium canariense]|nr:hypothetical protein BST65_01790 [Bradyrhizobium canariense]OSI39590.1 hypothetical protein BST66_01395 [Bradyrhizobium canariense]OSI55766.1 hypothetical protein BSZ20_01575 [Bradyrhizobium canariense]OSI57701.1 hypothetical protein BST67_01625 [Bradyrhizobium canariense]OSI60528.1 hypothetical protein BSZ15_01860 [Bradyrhizobium canariense]
MLPRYCPGSGQLQRIKGSAAKPRTIVQTILARILAFAEVTPGSLVMMHRFSIAELKVGAQDRYLGRERNGCAPNIHPL